MIEAFDVRGRGRVAYFSMEFALEDALPTYSGGLGVLAGDMMRSAADLGLPLVGVTLASRVGYFRQEIRDGVQVEHAEPWDPAALCRQMPCKVLVRIEGRDVWVGAWQHTVHSAGTQRSVEVLLLDTDSPENHPEDRTITHALYGGDQRYRLRQEIVLGIGGVRMLRALGLPVRTFHLNEGHSALLTLELLRELGATHATGARLEVALEHVRSRCVFTTHTPVEAGHDQYGYDLVQRCAGELAEPDLLYSLGGADRLNLTRLALRLSGWVNGVAQSHAQLSRRMFPGFEVHAITNGVHPLTWTAPPMREVYEQHIPSWWHEPELLVHAERIPDDALRAAHARARQALFDYVARTGGAVLDPARMTLGFARRMTSYKRPGLLFQDRERLRAISRRQPFQIVLAGKAHPNDQEGKRHIQDLHAWARELAGDVPVVFLPDYRLEIARLLVSGVDVWVNTPRPPMEASGTSGMKAALNGVPNLSVLDGWWLEGCEEGVTGWAVGNGTGSDEGTDAASLYEKLEQKVLPLWYGDPPGWTRLAKSTIARNGSYFNSHRMIRRYAAEAYWR